MELQMVVSLHLANHVSLLAEFLVGLLNARRMLSHVGLQKHRTELSLQLIAAHQF